MQFLKKLGSLFSSGSQDANSYYVVVQCSRCGETIQARVNLMNDLSLEYGDKGKNTYYCRKVLMGTQRCFQKVEVELWFDAERKLLDRQVQGGQFASK